ncbi:MAG: PPC domain-containing DNA-binding protein [Thermoplasmataceae archaeon]|nr:DUF296 domain-containing protein [Candidatus Thermoplasmatota archaeon]
MQLKRVDETLILKIEKGEDVMEILLETCRRENVSSGTIVWGIGMVKDAEIGYLDGREYVKEKYPQNLEVLSFHGTIARNDPRFHVHVSLAGRDHSALGGHLFYATADPSMEVQIEIFPDKSINRKMNDESGLNELSLH